MTDERKYFKRAFIRKIAYILATILMITIMNLFNILIVKADTTGSYTSASLEVRQCEISRDPESMNYQYTNCQSDSAPLNQSMGFGSNNGHITRYQWLLYNSAGSGWDPGTWEITLATWMRPITPSELIDYDYRFYANSRASTSGAESGMGTSYIDSYLCQQWTDTSAGNWYVKCKFTNKQPIRFFMIEAYLRDEQFSIQNTTGIMWWGIQDFRGVTDATSAINNQTQVIQNEFNEVNTNINNINDTMNDDSVDDPNEFFEDMEDFMPSNGVITQLIGLPITLYTKILNSINGTCASFSLGSLYNTNLVIPCIDVSDYLGSTLWGVIDAILSGFLVLGISRKFIKAFNNFTSLKEGDVISD